MQRIETLMIMDTPLLTTMVRNLGRDERTTLVIGFPLGAVGATGGETRFVAADFAELDEMAMIVHEPDVILSPLFSSAFDCIDVAFRLQKLGFHGKYRAVTEHLPHPAIVRREVRSLCPSLDFDIIQTGPSRRKLQ